MLLDAQNSHATATLGILRAENIRSEAMHIAAQDALLAVAIQQSSVKSLVSASGQHQAVLMP